MKMADVLAFLATGLYRDREMYRQLSAPFNYHMELPNCRLSELADNFLSQRIGPMAGDK